MKPIIFKTFVEKVFQWRKYRSIMLYSCFIILLCTKHSNAQTTEAYNWGNVAIGGGGFVSGIITSRTYGGPIYARTDVGGAYRWDATNSKWIPLTDFANESQQGMFGVLSMAIDPQHLNVVYALAGISYFNGGASYILRSSDYGATFTITNITSQFKVNGNALGRQNGERLQVDPYDSVVVYCGTQASGLFKSTNAGSTWTHLTSLSVSTTPNGNGVCFVLPDKYNGTTGGQTKTLFAGVSRIGSNQNFYRSDDAGTTFTAINNTNLADSLMPQRAAITNNGAYLYITYGNGSGPSANTGITPNENYNHGQIWRYTVATGAWVNVTPSGVNKPFCGIDTDPANTSRLVASTCNTYYTQSSGVYGDRFYLSTDSGSTWTDLVARGFSINDNGVPWLANASIHWAGCIKFDPSNTNRVMVTSGNGTFVNQDITNVSGVWNVNVRGIEEVVPRNMVSIVGGPVVSVISDYDGFTQSDPIVYAAQRHTPTMGSTTALDYAVTNKKIVRAASSMYYSTDQGYTWTKSTIMNGSNGQVALSVDGNTILQCPSGSSLIYKSTNNGTSWTNTNQGVTDARPIADGATAAKFYIYDSTNGKLLVSTNSGTSFTAATGTIAAGGSKIIRSVPGYDGDVWIALNGGGLAYTQNSGSSFTTVANVTSCLSVGIGKIAPCSTYPTIYIWGSVSSSANGLYRSFDMGANWARVNDDGHQYGGPGNGQFVIGDMNTVGNVYMSTAGRGIAFGARIPALAVTPTTLTYGYTAGSQTVNVTSTENWAASANQSWITISAVSVCGSTPSFTVNVSSNTGTSTRTGTVTVTGGGVTKTIEINQNYNCTATTITPYVKVNANAWVQTPYASLAAGGNVSLGPQPNVTTGWDWTGPNGFTATAREVDLINIQSSQAGNYIATYTNSGGCKASQTFIVVVTGGTGGSDIAQSKSTADTLAATHNTAIVAVVQTPDANAEGIVTYPNPTSNYVTIHIPASMVGGKITLVNSTGLSVLKMKATQADSLLDMSKLTPGFYIINVSNNKNNLSGRIIKKISN